MSGCTDDGPLLEVEDLVTTYRRDRRDTIRAVDGVTFALHPGETLALVGESGCGKSTVARTILGLVPATSGSVRYQGQDLLSLGARRWRSVRRDIQVIFQDPDSSLNPRLPVGRAIAEPWAIHHGIVSHRARVAKVCELLEQVGIDPRHRRRYPHQFSGGQRQRIGIARALALKPRILICDEPVSALDVSIQAQILNLLKEIQRTTGLTMFFISHDLAVVRNIADSVAVMYLGRLMEHGSAETVYTAPSHPYTRALLSAVPVPDPAIAQKRRRKRILLTGDLPDPAAERTGCPFASRCPLRRDRCQVEVPALISRESPHPTACHYAHELPPWDARSLTGTA